MINFLIRAPLFLCLKALLDHFFSIRLRASNHQIGYSEFPFKTFRSEIRFHTSPGLS